MAMIWLEAVLPLGIIASMLCVMGNAQYFIHKAANGRHIGNDVWDALLGFFCFCILKGLLE
ncbi:NADH dehydrogenase [ubiquinone] 1 alpha subcomplex subunit 1 [Olea europaea subsp. europaea]|uniref:NADH dehydrogenase [ubiquinone] 1 alpha subcomplex subunit 1 n=1 Tax=Olea europaea subsp. europaea TaxID=158383 RepID=A0A8S0UTU0_OLEEU|nr:NADH dehydrogenase [ubiquinone] 1 alpha subcomplex subunit 1 [Olea europaea subsp. europaea]